MSFDEKLAERIRTGLARYDAVEKRMFGGLCFMVNDAMCCGVHKDDFVARAGPERHTDALRSPHARPMDITGRPLLQCKPVPGSHPGTGSSPLGQN